MNDPTCDDVHRALERPPEHGEPAPGLDDALAAHLRSCQACAEAAAVAGRLRLAARRQPPRDGLPSASHLWWRARIIRDLLERESAVELAVRPVRWLQVAVLGLLCLAITLALSWLTANLLGGLETQIAGATVSLRWLGGLLLAGTVVPLAGFAAVWLLWRET